MSAGRDSNGVLNGLPAKTLLSQFKDSFLCLPAPERPNTLVKFPLHDIFAPKLVNSPSPFILESWHDLLARYPGSLRFHICSVIRYGALVGYNGPQDILRIEENHQSINLAPEQMDASLQKDLLLSRVEEVDPTPPFICSPLGFAAKEDGSLRRTHDLSSPINNSVNDAISKESAYLKYTTIKEIIALVVEQGPGSLMLKEDLADAFRNIAFALQIRWLFGFQWRNRFFRETCLPFGLRTSPFIFNLFAEALHWILESYLLWTHLRHYLDDFIRILPPSTTPAQVETIIANYTLLLRVLGVPRRVDKAACGTLVKVLGYIFNTVTMTISIPEVKVLKMVRMTAEALAKDSMSLKEVRELAGLCSWCAPAVQLGWVFCRNIWNYLASFPPIATKHWKRRIPDIARQDILWWNQLMESFNGVSFFGPAKDTVHLYTDASTSGVGGFAFKSNSISRWQDAVSADLLDPNLAYAEVIPTVDGVFDINIWEVRAVLRALQLWASQWKGLRLVVHTDNNTTLARFSKQSLSSPANVYLREAIIVAANHDIQLVAERIPGEENDLADALSRLNFIAVANISSQLARFLNYEAPPISG